MSEIERLLAERAAAMAAHDGVPVSAVHRHGAANQLQAELISARDRAPAAQPPVPEPQPAPAKSRATTPPAAEEPAPPNAPEPEGTDAAEEPAE